MTIKNNVHGYLCATVTKAKTGQTKALARWNHNLLTNNGRDKYHQVALTDTSATLRGAGYIASTESTITPAAGDTTLSGEITTNGLGRADAGTKTHSAGTNSTLLEHTFTASGAFTDVKASATFNASSGVTMFHIANFSTGSGTLATNDTLKISWTINIG
jgi:hypothetical protein